MKEKTIQELIEMRDAGENVQQVIDRKLNEASELKSIDAIIQKAKQAIEKESDWERKVKRAQNLVEFN